MLDHVSIDAYGQRVPLSHSATVTVRDPQTLLVTLHDPSVRPRSFVPPPNTLLGPPCLSGEWLLRP